MKVKKIIIKEDGEGFKIKAITEETHNGQSIFTRDKIKDKGGRFKDIFDENPSIDMIMTGSHGFVTVRSNGKWYNYDTDPNRRDKQLEADPLTNKELKSLMFDYCFSQETWDIENLGEQQETTRFEGISKIKNKGGK